ncbi:hypothetical protein ABKN59_004723 [Abortiporus biennis]
MFVGMTTTGSSSISSGSSIQLPTHSVPPSIASSSYHLNGNGVATTSTTTSTSTATNGTAGSHGGGIRSQLGHLLPSRHALFQVHLTIDDLSNVPRVKGEFGVKWKFKNVQSGSSLINKLKTGKRVGSGGSSSGVYAENGGIGKSAMGSSFNLSLSGKKGAERKKKSNWKGKEKAMEKGLGLELGSSSESEFSNDTHFSDSEDLGRESFTTPRPTSAQRKTSTDSSSSGAPKIYGQFLTSSPPETPDISPSSTPQPLVTPTPTQAHHTHHHRPHLPRHNTTPASAAPTITKASFPHMLGQANTAFSESKGMTDWSKLRNYTVRWDHKVSVVVQMDVHRETLDLLPSELRLVVMQRVVAGDPDAPSEPRLGAVYLNLAEYANAAVVTRRYLLSESKTNALLKLTIELEHIGGTDKFLPPPLRKGEIMAEVSGLLSNNGLLRTRLARNLDLYTRSDSHLASFDPSSPSLFSPHSPQIHLPPHDNSLNIGIDGRPIPRKSSSYPYPYSRNDGLVDFDKLAIVNGLRTTENLIESLFNPIPTSSDVPSPFTFYNPEKARELEQNFESSLSLSLATGGDGRDDASMISAETTYTRNSGTSGGGVGGFGAGNSNNSQKESSPSVYGSILTDDSSSFGGGDKAESIRTTGSGGSKPPTPVVEKGHWWNKLRNGPVLTPPAPPLATINGSGQSTSSRPTTPVMNSRQQLRSSPMTTLDQE